MNSDEAWNRLNTVTNVAMRRWTSARPGYKTFKLERHGDGERAVYQIIIQETGREPRWFDRERFDTFWKLWAEGKRNPNDYRNVGPAGGMYKHAYYMLPIATALEARREAHTSAPKREFKYGEKQTWQMAVDAVRALGGTATIDEVEQYLAKQNPLFKPTNVRPDLDLVTVNAFGRANWSPNQKPRVVDGSAPSTSCLSRNEALAHTRSTIPKFMEFGNWPPCQVTRNCGRGVWTFRRRKQNLMLCETNSKLKMSSIQTTTLMQEQKP